MPMKIELSLIGVVAAALIVALIVALVATPVVKSLAFKMGAMDVPKDNRRMHDHPIPRMGGLAIFLGFLLSVLLFAEITPQLRGMLLGSVIIVVLGIFDDFYSLPAMFKDGLACGVSTISSMTLLVISLVVSDAPAAILMAALAGSCIGFLPYNLNPAKIFMGDTGSTFLGYVLAVVSIQGLFKFYTIISFAVPFLMLGLPIFDTCFAFIRRIAHGQSPMHADRSHVHHRLIDMGFSQKQAVAVLYIISAILGLSAVVLTTAGAVKAMLLLLALCAAGAVSARIFLSNNEKKNGQEQEEKTQESEDKEERK